MRYKIACRDGVNCVVLSFLHTAIPTSSSRGFRHGYISLHFWKCFVHHCTYSWVCIWNLTTILLYNSLPNGNPNNVPTSDCTVSPLGSDPFSSTPSVALSRLKNGKVRPEEYTSLGINSLFSKAIKNQSYLVECRCQQYPHNNLQSCSSPHHKNMTSYFLHNLH